MSSQVGKSTSSQVENKEEQKGSSFSGYMKNILKAAITGAAEGIDPEGARMRQEQERIGIERERFKEQQEENKLKRQEKEEEKKARQLFLTLMGKMSSLSDEELYAYGEFFLSKGLTTEGAMLWDKGDQRKNESARKQTIKTATDRYNKGREEKGLPPVSLPEDMDVNTFSTALAALEQSDPENKKARDEERILDLKMKRQRVKMMPLEEQQARQQIDIGQAQLKAIPGQQKEQEQLIKSRGLDIEAKERELQMSAGQRTVGDLMTELGQAQRSKIGASQEIMGQLGGEAGKKLISSLEKKGYSFDVSGKLPLKEVKAIAGKYVAYLQSKTKLNDADKDIIRYIMIMDEKYKKEFYKKLNSFEEIKKDPQRLSDLLEDIYSFTFFNPSSEW